MTEQEALAQEACDIRDTLTSGDYECTANNATVGIPPDFLREQRTHCLEMAIDYISAMRGQVMGTATEIADSFAAFINGGELK